MFNIVVLFKKNIRIKTIHIHIHIHFTNQNTHIHIYMLQKNHTYIHTFYIIKSVKKKKKKTKKSDFCQTKSSSSRRGDSQRRATASHLRCGGEQRLAVGTSTSDGELAFFIHTQCSKLHHILSKFYNGSLLSYPFS